MQLVLLRDTMRVNCFYYTYHERNGSYLERENEPEKFYYLSDLCDVSFNFFFTEFDALIKELEIVLHEAYLADDLEIALHIMEIIVLAKFCIFNENKYALEFTPWGSVKELKKMPKHLARNLSGLVKFLTKEKE